MMIIIGMQIFRLVHRSGFQRLHGLRPVMLEGGVVMPWCDDAPREETRFANSRSVMTRF